MGNIRTEKKKRRLRRKKERTESSQKKEIRCISCGNPERTIDYTGRCDSCRRDIYERECWMCDFD